MDITNLPTLSGWVALVFLSLNFLTCLAMPWSKTKCLWQGKYPGPDKCDLEGFRPVAYLHKIFVWLTIVFTIVHIIVVIAFR